MRSWQKFLKNKGLEYYYGTFEHWDNQLFVKMAEKNIPILVYKKNDNIGIESYKNIAVSEKSLAVLIEYHTAEPFEDSPAWYYKNNKVHFV